MATVDLVKTALGDANLYAAHKTLLSSANPTRDAIYDYYVANTGGTRRPLPDMQYDYWLAGGVVATILAPYHLDWPAWGAADSSSGMTFTRLQNTTSAGGGAAIQASLADADNGDSYSYLFDVDAGTYTVTLLYAKGTDVAIYDVKVDGVSVGTADGYVAGTSFNNVATFAGVVLTAGVHTLSVAANGKNASSTDYYIRSQWLSLDRTGA